MCALLRRTRVLIAVVITTGLVLALRGSVFALDATLDISQYAHTSWTIRDGAFSGAVNAIAQTSDGYLWLGTDVGVLRFDGVRMVPWEPLNQGLPSMEVNKLVA